MRKLPLSAFAAALAVVFVFPVCASDPDGFLAFRTEWIEPEEESGVDLGSNERLLVLDVRPQRDLTDAVLSWRTPAGVQATVLTPIAGPPLTDGPPPEPGRWALGSLESRQVLVFRFAVKVPDAGGGIAAFQVEGLLADGRPVKEAVGVPVGRAYAEGRHRAGAVEFLTPTLEGESR